MLWRGCIVRNLDQQETWIAWRWRRRAGVDRAVFLGAREEMPTAILCLGKVSALDAYPLEFPALVIRPKFTVLGGNSIGCNKTAKFFGLEDYLC